MEPTFEDMWTGVQNSIGLHVNELVAFAQDVNMFIVKLKVLVVEMTFLSLFLLSSD